MRTAGIAYLAGLVGITLDGRLGTAVVFLASAVTAAVVRHLAGRGLCRHRRGTRGTGSYAGSR